MGLIYIMDFRTLIITTDVIYLEKHSAIYEERSKWFDLELY